MERVGLADGKGQDLRRGGGGTCNWGGGSSILAPPPRDSSALNAARPNGPCRPHGYRPQG
eukprot:8812690-Pyramimonas_sp.AAC.1